MKRGVTEVGGSGERGREIWGRGDGSETGRVKELEEKNLQPVSMHISPGTLGIKGRATIGIYTHSDQHLGLYVYK